MGLQCTFNLKGAGSYPTRLKDFREALEDVPYPHYTDNPIACEMIVSGGGPDNSVLYTMTIRMEMDSRGDVTPETVGSDMERIARHCGKTPGNIKFENRF